MAHEASPELARERFLDRKTNNLDNLLFNRYGWMNSYLKTNDRVIEVGCGAGFGGIYIDSAKLVLTDVIKRPYTSEMVNALNMPYGDNSVDAIISSHMIHHLATPSKFFNEVRRVLKPGGYLLIQEIETSLLMRLLLRAMRHEGWSSELNVFDPEVIANDPSDPWSANCSIPQLLFRDESQFTQHFPFFKFVKNELNECLAFPLSGGVIAKTKTIELPRPLLAVVNSFDRFLIRILPQVFALGRSVALQKV